ncbi:MULTISPECIES: hypothetical protein [unclassified Oscillibacter]|uniref:hypothetical protein n=1 Tax=unclassified Oscillibacter TaxID=2629304 RepID=UPI0025DE1CB9|nr:MULTISPECIES: hypothetical protein [unclassified Oscillibacter]
MPVFFLGNYAIALPHTVGIGAAIHSSKLQNIVADYQFMNERYDACNVGLQEKVDAIEKRRKLDTNTTSTQRYIKAAIQKIVTEKSSMTSAASC